MSTRPANNIDVHRLEKVVCVMFHLHAGTGLMSTLLDGHPNLLNTPDNILLGFYEFWDNNGNLPASQIISRFIDDYAVLFDAWATCKAPRVNPQVGDLLNWTSLGADRDEKLEVDQEAFRRVMEDLIGTNKKVSRKLFFQSLHSAYACALGRRVNDPQIVFGLHVPHPALLRKFFEDFPAGKFLQMLRHPIPNLGSDFRATHTSGELEPTTAASIISISLSGPLVPHERRSQWRGVRLEDIHLNPRDTMQRVCDWLQLPWNDTLLKTTINGKQYWNEKGRPQVTGPNNTIIAQRHEQYFPFFDRFRLNVLSGKICRTHGYEVKARYRWMVTKLLILPLLVIPLKIELMCLFSAPRNPHSSVNSTIDLRTRSIISRIPTAAYGFYRGRKVMIGAWLRLFTKENNKLEMI